MRWQDQGSRTRLQRDFWHIDSVVAANTSRVADAIRSNQSSPDLLRQGGTLNQVVAQVMGTQSAVASMKILSGAAPCCQMGAGLPMHNSTFATGSNRTWPQVHMQYPQHYMHACVLEMSYFVRPARHTTLWKRLLVPVGSAA